MKFAVHLFGRQIFSVDYDNPPTTCGHKPTLEATSGGQFEIGFTTPGPAVIDCIRRDSGRL